jgi:hypothetical protein
MEKIRWLSIFGVTVFIFFAWNFSAQAQVFPEFVGDMCWSFNASNGDSGYLRLGVTDMSGQSGKHYQLNGIFVVTNVPLLSTSIAFPINGNAEPLSDGFHLTLTSSRFGSDFGITVVGNEGMTYSVMHASLDSTLNGQFSESVTASNSTSSAISFRSGTLVLLPACP